MTTKEEQMKGRGKVKLKREEAKEKDVHQGKNETWVSKLAGEAKRARTKQRECSQHAATIRQ